MSQRGFSYNAEGTDADGDTLLWSLDAAPDGMVVDPLSGQVSWTPTAQQIGNHTVQLRATDIQGAYSGQAFELQVTGANTPPSIVSQPLTQGSPDQAYRYHVVATDPEQNELSFSLGVRPEGMQIDSVTGEIDWTPNTAQVGSHAVEVLVTDTQGGVNRQVFDLEVAEEAEEAINNAPSINSLPIFQADTGIPYHYAVEATDPDVGDSLSYRLLEAPTGVNIDETGKLTWENPVFGNHKIVIGVEDNKGLGTAQGFTLTVLDNSAPVIQSTPKEIANLGQPYQYDFTAFDPDSQSLSYSLDTDSIERGMKIDELGRLRWTPDTVETDLPITITVTDPLGASVSQSFDLSVVADNEAPALSLNPSWNPLYLGQDITFYVNATDNVGVANLQLLINDEPVVLNRYGQATLENPPASEIVAVAIATDAAGNITEESITIPVIDNSDNQAPVINWNPVEGVVTNPIEIFGTVQDDNLSYYSLSVAPLGSNNFQEVFRNTESVDNGVLATFDPTLLANDAYTLRFTAGDVGGNEVFLDQTIDVGGDLKLGNFTLSFTDLEIPLSGIPINVTRTYDSLNANTTDDFGYGWRMEFRDTDLRTNVAPPSAERQLLGQETPFHDEARVYVTLPGGKRTGFTFKPKLHHLASFMASAGPEALWYQPEFVADDGSTLTLSVKGSEDTKLVKGAGTNEYFDLSGTPFNPASPRFGQVYVLTTKEGIEYEIDAISGDLLKVIDTNGNTLTYSDEGIVSSTGQEVTFKRDAQNRIIAVVDPEGNEIRYNYDANGDLISVTDREENTTQLEYHDERDHYLDTIIDPLGREGVRAEYDENGRLSQLIDVNGEAVELVYDPDNSVQTVKDVFGNPTTYEYDSRGNVVQEIDAVGKITRRTYDEQNNLLTETIVVKDSTAEGEARELTTTYTYDAQGNQLTMTDPLGNTTRSTYNSNGRLLSDTDALGNTTTYTYDSRGNLLTTVDAANQVTGFNYSASGNLLSLADALNQQTRFSYNTKGELTQMTDAEGNTTRYEYDTNGNRVKETRTVTTPTGIQELVTQWTYDKENRIVTTTDPAGSTTHYEYDANGNQTAVIDALGRRTEYRYDERGQLIQTIYPDNTPNDLSDNPNTISLYDRGGRLRASIDLSGSVTHFVYDAVDRLIATIQPDENETLEQLLAAIAPGEILDTVDWTEIVYPDNTPDYLNDNHRVQTEYTQDGKVKASIDERGNRTEYRYDDLGRLTTTIYADDTPNDLSDNPTTTVKYDTAGRRIAQTDALNRTTRYKYDDLGRLIETIFPDNSSTETSYDALGRRDRVTDPEGNSTQYFYDSLGRLTGVKDAMELLTQYRYDELGRLIEVEDANNNITRYEYDKAGRRTVVELPQNQRSTSTYDAAGNLQTYTDFNQEVTAFDYDAMGRLIEKDYEDDADVSYSYTADGQIHTITDGRGVTEFGYDAQGRLTWRNDPDGAKTANGHTIEYEYDTAGNRTAVITPNGRVSYTYDEQNRLETVTDPDSGTSTYQYDDNGNLIQTEFPNGVIETREYDELNRLIGLENKLGDEVISGYRYDLNKAGHRLSVTEADGRQVSYTYDDLYRLTEENINNGERVISYTYDNVGNRLTRTDSVEGTTSYTYDENDRLLTETLVKDGETVHTISYTYDDNGNLISRTQVADGISETTTYTWNDDDRLVAVNTPDGTIITYEYDDEGIRVSSTVNGQKTEYLIDKNQPYAQVLEEFKSGDLEAFYVYGHDLISQTRDGEQDTYHVDGLGSTRTLTDEQGNITDTYDYDAFGELIDSEGDSDNDYLFAGEQFDKNLEDYYLRQRFYDPGSGRFLRRDTYEGRLNEPITLHKYLYANANPVYYTDPTGLFGIADHAAASSIRDILNSIQTDNGITLINRAATGEEVTPKTIGLDFIFSAFLGMAVPKFIGEGAEKLLAKWGEPSSEVLRANMKAAGKTVPRFPNAAHHIVPGSDNRFPDAIAARTHLARLGVASNDAANGVFLEYRKRGKAQIGSGAIHNDIHTEVYYRNVKREVLQAKNKKQAEDILRDIGERLQNDNFPYR